MIPVPKPKFFERNVPDGQSENDYLDEIIARQTHILRDAIDRVSFSRIHINRNLEIHTNKNLQLVCPSAMDPAGILMLRSVRIVFETIGIKPESIKFIKEEFTAENLVETLNVRPKKCPAVVTFNLIGDQSPHVMVATNALKGAEFIQGNTFSDDYMKEKWFINCKNSYRDDVSQPGIFFAISYSKFSMVHTP